MLDAVTNAEACGECRMALPGQSREQLAGRGGGPVVEEIGFPMVLPDVCIRMSTADYLTVGPGPFCWQKKEQIWP